MKLNTEVASELYQDATRKPPGDADCPSEEQLLAAAQSATPAAKRLAVAQHLALCSTCSKSYLAARREATPAQDARSWRLQPWALQLAAVLVLSIGAGWLLRSQLDTPQTAANETRRTAQPTESPAAELTSELTVEPADGAELASAPERLSWSGRPTATTQVLVFDQLLEPLWQSDSLNGTGIVLPDELRQRLTPGSTVYWRVVERVDLERRESPLFRFQITAESR